MSEIVSWVNKNTLGVRMNSRALAGRWWGPGVAADAGTPVSRTLTGKLLPSDRLAVTSCTQSSWGRAGDTGQPHTDGETAAV